MESAKLLYIKNLWRVIMNLAKILERRKWDRELYEELSGIWESVRLGEVKLTLFERELLGSALQQSHIEMWKRKPAAWQHCDWNKAYMPFGQSTPDVVVANLTPREMHIGGGVSRLLSLYC